MVIIGGGRENMLTVILNEHTPPVSFSTEIAQTCREDFLVSCYAHSDSAVGLAANQMITFNGSGYRMMLPMFGIQVSKVLGSKGKNR